MGTFHWTSNSWGTSPNPPVSPPPQGCSGNPSDFADWLPRLETQKENIGNPLKQLSLHDFGWFPLQLPKYILRHQGTVSTVTYWMKWHGVKRCSCVTWLCGSVAGVCSNHPISIPGSNSWPDSIHGKNDPMSRPSVHPSDSSPQFFSTRDPFRKPCRLDSSFFKDCATNLFNHQPLRYDAWRSTANKSFWSKWTWSHFGKILYQLITEPWSPKTIPGDFISLPCHLSESVTKKSATPLVPWPFHRFRLKPYGNKL